MSRDDHRTPLARYRAMRARLTALEQDSTLITLIEMSQSKWLVAAIVPGLERQPLKKLDADAEALLKLLHRWRNEAEQSGHMIRLARPRQSAAALVIVKGKSLTMACGHLGDHCVTTTAVPLLHHPPGYDPSPSGGRRRRLRRQVTLESMFTVPKNHAKHLSVRRSSNRSEWKVE
jgi:transposase